MAGPGYIVAQVNVKDFPQYFDEYGQPTLAVATAHGGEFLAATRDVETLEGEWSGNWTVVARFPSLAAARAFFASAAYAPLREARMTRLTNGANVVMFEGIDPTQGRP